MTSREKTEGRSTKKLLVAGAMFAAAGASLLLLTEFPPGLASGAGASTALAELAARSPGMRIGGVALKAKTRRAALPALAKPVAAAPAGRGTPTAQVMSAETAAPPAAAPATLGIFPGEAFISSPQSAVAAAPAPGGFGFVPVPGGGGVIIGPGGGGSGGPGGIGGATPNPTPTPTVTPSPTPTPTATPPVVVVPTPSPTVPPVSAVPEPSTWLMLITGFGLLGSAVRRQRRRRPA